MRKRGAHFTRRVDPLAAFRSADRQHPLDSGQKLQLGVVLRTHLEALRTGKADATAFHNLTPSMIAEMTGLSVKTLVTSGYLARPACTPCYAPGG